MTGVDVPVDGAEGDVGDGGVVVVAASENLSKVEVSGQGDRPWRVRYL